MSKDIEKLNLLSCLNENWIAEKLVAAHLILYLITLLACLVYLISSMVQVLCFTMLLYHVQYHGILLEFFESCCSK